MITPLAKLIDCYALQVASMLWTFQKWSDSKLMEAIEFLHGPNFITGESKPAQLEFKSKVDFPFPSPRPCEFAENNIVHGRLYFLSSRKRLAEVPGMAPHLSARAFKFPRHVSAKSGFQYSDEEIHDMGMRLLSLCEIAAKVERLTTRW